MNNDHLLINNFDAVDLAKKYGTPLYVYDGNKIEENFSKIAKAIPYEFKQIHYAIMCNDRFDILKILFNLGAYLQVNSLKEYKSARKVGFPNEKISVATTNISPNDMEEFIRYGANLNLDSIEEVERYGQIVERLDNKNLNRKIGIRIFIDKEASGRGTINAPYSPKARVGIKPEKFTELKKVTEKYNLKIVGVHGYMASNMLNLEPFLRLNKYLFENAKQFPELEYINFGAGFGISVRPDEKEFDWKGYGESVVDLTQEASKFFNRNINLKIEPGRSLIADVGTLLAQVTNIKDMDSWQEVGVDCGFGVFARPYIYKWNEGGYHPVIVANRTKQKAEKVYTVCGNSVLQNDYLAEDRKLPGLEIGDYLAILKTGAYGATMMSMFPGMRRPGEILIYNDRIKVIQKTETN